MGSGLFYEDAAEGRTSSWTMDNGYNDTDIALSYPYRVLKSEFHYGLHTLIGLRNEDIETVCKGPISGFKVLLHTPDEMPKMTHNFLRVPLNQEVIIMINPMVIRTSPDLSSYSPAKYAIAYTF